MNILSHCASRLVAIVTFALLVPALSSASNAGQTTGFKLAMGPMSAAQKNQGQGPVANSDAVEIKPHHHVRLHHHVKHRRRHHGR